MYPISIVICGVDRKKYPELKIRITNNYGAPIEIDNLKLYSNNTLLEVDLEYLGNGTYLITNIAIPYQSIDYLCLYLIKESYLMFLIEVSFDILSSEEPDLRIYGYEVILMIGLAIMITWFTIKKFFRKINKKLVSMVKNLKYDFN